MESFSQYGYINISEVCRICLLKKDDMKTITEDGLNNLLFDCAHIQVIVLSKIIQNSDSLIWKLDFSSG
jgi:hypothetical protein